MNQRLLTILALGFGALLILQAALGGWLFIHNIGISPHEITAYYADKSLHGLLEVLFPHTLFIGIGIMVVLHFLAFIEAIELTVKIRFGHILFALFFLDQMSVLAIMMGFDFFSIIKLISFFGFEGAVVILWGWMFTVTLKKI